MYFISSIAGSPDKTLVVTFIRVVSNLALTFRRYFSASDKAPAIISFSCIEYIGNAALKCISIGGTTLTSSAVVI